MNREGTRGTGHDRADRYREDDTEGDGNEDYDDYNPEENENAENEDGEEENENDDDLVTDSDDDDDDNDNNNNGEGNNQGNANNPSSPSHQSDNKNQQPLYANKAKQIILKKGNFTLTAGEAKLYGFITPSGELKQPQPEKRVNIKKLQEMNNKLSTTKDHTNLIKQTNEVVAKQCTFQPKKSTEAMKAMQDPRCGYDFINKLGEGEDFLQRQFASKNKNKESKFVREGLKEDYEARLDRLQCPKCKKYQSFDEYMDKRRFCGPCQERFVKLHVSKFKQWETKQQEHEEKKKEKLAKVQHELYENCSFQPKITPIDQNLLDTHRSIAMKTKEEKIKEENKKKLHEEEEERIKQEKLKRIQDRLIQSQALKRQHQQQQEEQQEKNQQEKQSKRPSSAPPRRLPSNTANTTNKTKIETTKRPKSGKRNGQSTGTKKLNYTQLHENISEKFQQLLTTEIE